MSIKPTISVIIVTYNRANLLLKAIKSVLTQSYRDFELIIIDDASTDNTKESVANLMAQDQRIKYFKNEVNLDIAKSRNRGISLADGEYVAMLDSDDYWLDNNKLSKQLAYLENNLAFGLIGTAIRCEDEKGQVIKEDIFATEDGKIRSLMLWKNQIAQSSVLFRKSAYIKAGGYDEILNIGEDYDLWLKIGCDFKLSNLSDVSVAYLIHSESRTKERKIKTIMATDKIVKRYKKNYPGYFKARLKSVFRLLRYILC
ncbi:MAG: glycosyltransferase family 2 protein [Patescibacteria group bacterium]